MPEDKKNPSGKKPEGSAMLKPTVLTPQPNQNRDRKAAPETARPQVLQVTKPTAVRGMRREQLEASASELRLLVPKVSEEICEQAKGLIRSFVKEKASERSAILWGHELQKSYGEIVSQTLAFAGAPILVRVRDYLTRMIDILKSIDIMAVCGQSKRGILEGLTRSVNAKIDTPEELSTAQAELSQLLGYMSSALKELLDLKDRLEAHSGKINGLAAEAESSALAALYIANCLRQEQGKESVADRFEERSMSLTQTLAQIRQNDQAFKIQIKQPIDMISSIQNVALVMLPGFIGSIASVLILLKNKSVSPTEAGEVHYKLQDIVNQLK